MVWAAVTLVTMSSVGGRAWTGSKFAMFLLECAQIGVIGLSMRHLDLNLSRKI